MRKMTEGLFVSPQQLPSESPESSLATGEAAEGDCRCTGWLPVDKLVVCGNGMLLEKGVQSSIIKFSHI